MYKQNNKGYKDRGMNRQKMEGRRNEGRKEGMKEGRKEGRKSK